MCPKRQFPKISPHFIAIAGPTGSGKSEVAFCLAKKLNGEIISCDSMQVYRGMNILTQASPKDGPIPVRLVSFLSPGKEYDAAAYSRDAFKCLQAVLKRGKTPIIVGGTGLYLRALLDGLFQAQEGGPLKDERFRKKMLQVHEEHGDGFLHQKLSRVDEAAAKSIHPNDIRRIVRALEVHHLTGRPFSSEKKNRKGIRDQFFHRVYFLDLGRQELYERVNRRVERMIEGGLVKEVRSLLGKNIGQTASMALGFREIRAYLRGETTLDSAVENLRQNTRRYAKRQWSWFRREKDVVFIPVEAGESASHIAQRILNDWKLWGQTPEIAGSDPKMDKP